MKISKEKLEQIILEEIEESLFRSLGKKLGLGRSNYEKGLKGIQKRTLETGHPFIAIADFIDVYGDDSKEVQELAANYRKQGVEHSTKKASTPLKSRPIVAEEFKKGKMSIEEITDFLGSPSFKKWLDDLDLEQFITKKKDVADPTPRLRRGEAEPQKQNGKNAVTDKKGREMVEKIGEAIANLLSNPNFQKAFEVEDLQLFDSVSEISETEYAEASEEGKQKLADIKDAVTNLMQYVDFEKMRDKIRSIMNESKSLTEWDLDVMILEEIIKDALIKDTIRFS